VHAVAEGHHGRVEYQEREGGGARFVVRLPAAQTSTTTGSTIGRRLSRP
jgi:signal transduction histidine kinase